MLRIDKGSYRSNQGLTLVELMVVVIIIGILATIAIPNLMEAQDKDQERSNHSFCSSSRF